LSRNKAGKNISAMFFGVLLSLYCFNTSLAQITDKTVIAEVGKSKITASEFTKLYELSPHISIDSNDPFMARLNFLNTLIAYKLWYENKGVYKLDTSAAYNTAYKELRKMFIRDALYRKEILGKIKISPAEMSGAKMKQKRILSAGFIVTDNVDESKRLLGLLDSGIPFDTLLSARSEASLQKEPVKIKFGDYNEIVESSLFSLKEGEYSPILQFRDGYYIFYIKKVNISPDDEENITKKAEGVIKKRKENVLYDAFMKNALNGVKANVDGKLFKSLNTVISNEFKKSFLKDSLYYLDADRYAEIKHSFSKEELESPFITMPGNKICLGDFLNSIIFEGLKMQGKDSLSILNGLNLYVKDFISKEVIYKKGEKAGGESLPGVREDLQEWAEYYAFETLRGSMLDTVSVSREEVLSAYNTQYKDTLTGNQKFETIAPLIRTRIANEKLKPVITKMTARLASGAAIKINYENLNKVELTKISSFAIRNLGFGGTLTGVPMYMPNYDWAESKNTVNQLP
jgi:hypothetical protein